jgi:hypothetical protein
MTGKISTLFLCIVFALTCNAQQAKDETAIKDVILRLFIGMEKGDSAMVRAVFTPQPTLATVLRNKNDEPVLRQESSLNEFLKAVGTPHKEVWYEDIWNIKIQMDGDFAQVWCDYAFYVDKTFSHCGVDAFQLHRGKDGWRIFHLADTRRKTGCEVPSDINNKRK